MNENYREIDGDLIVLAKQGRFDVIAHGCNCFCTMGAGIAPQMAKAFGCDTFSGEEAHKRGDPTKLGNISYEEKFLLKGEVVDLYDNDNHLNPDLKSLFVVNCYTQFDLGFNHPGGKKSPIDYEALTLCMRKMNMIFNGLTIGLPKIGAGLAGGDWEKIKNIIQEELKNCKIIIVNYKK